MLEITIPGAEMYDETKEEFISFDACTLQLEHSLVSISKWESKWHKLFLSKQEKTNEEVLDYIRCMTLTENVDPNVYLGLTNDNVKAINEYIENPMTATYVPDTGGKTNKEQVSSELIYYWMIAQNVPPEYQHWHLNRLLTLLRVCSVKNAPPKQTSKSEMASRYASLNAARRKKLNTKG